MPDTGSTVHLISSRTVDRLKIPTVEVPRDEGLPISTVLGSAVLQTRIRDPIAIRLPGDVATPILPFVSNCIPADLLLSIPLLHSEGINWNSSHSRVSTFSLSLTDIVTNGVVFCDFLCDRCITEVPVKPYIVAILDIPYLLEKESWDSIKTQCVDTADSFLQSIVAQLDTLFETRKGLVLIMCSSQQQEVLLKILSHLPVLSRTITKPQSRSSNWTTESMVICEPKGSLEHLNEVYPDNEFWEPRPHAGEFVTDMSDQILNNTQKSVSLITSFILPLLQEFAPRELFVVDGFA
eukprot:Nk52_evm1s720 gene=Nk52_evmTU1s720